LLTAMFPIPDQGSTNECDICHGGNDQDDPVVVWHPPGTSGMGVINSLNQDLNAIAHPVAMFRVERTFRGLAVLKSLCSFGPK